MCVCVLLYVCHSSYLQEVIVIYQICQNLRGSATDAEYCRTVAMMARNGDQAATEVNTGQNSIKSYTSHIRGN